MMGMLIDSAAKLGNYSHSEDKIAFCVSRSFLVEVQTMPSSETQGQFFASFFFPPVYTFFRPHYLPCMRDGNPKIRIVRSLLILSPVI